jgi:hypothetical protein
MTKVAAKALPDSTRTVIVACLIPNGLVLQLQRPMEKFEDTRDGPRPRSYNVKYGEQRAVRGPARPVGTLPKDFDKWRPPVQIEGGYALTHGIPRDFWEQWLEQNAKAEYVVNDMISGHATIEDAVAWAREREALRSGHEPISTDEDARGRLTDRRLPKPIGNSVAGIGTEPR